jgi:protease-4
LSPFVGWDDPTRERVRQQMASIYELFLDRCAKGRKIPKEKLRESAEGRIWSGEQGKARGLVDEFGGLSRALEVTRKLADLEEDAPVILEGAREGLLETLMLGDDANAQEIERAAVRFQLQRAPLVRLPAELASFAAGIESLGHESVVTALPFGLTVK